MASHFSGFIYRLVFKDAEVAQLVEQFIRNE